ncbi:MAG TPA: NAD-dependent epimerase/dehydratase family protein [Solirubrobacteraceae bacterium]|nr:NAD-dependent epimerase/dehydratase family protein [Solirubrobacteraceae bacterium]
MTSSAREPREPDPILLTGASGYVGSHLLAELLRRGRRVRALARRPAPGRLPAEVEVHRGDAVSGDGLRDALDGCRTAYYLIHSMGRGSGPADEFARRDREAAVNFGEAARDCGTERVVYLGGLGPVEDDASEHLRSRHEVARLLRERVPELVHVRAAMIIGAGSASFEMLHHLTRRLPVMVTPRWLDTRTQPIATGDVVRALADLAEVAGAPAEVELGGADVLTYRDMIIRTAAVLGRRRPVIVKVPVLTPQLSSYWVALVTPVEAGLVRPLVDGLKAEMVVGTAPPAGVNDRPLGFEDAVRAALA